MDAAPSPEPAAPSPGGPVPPALDPPPAPRRRAPGRLPRRRSGRLAAATAALGLMTVVLGLPLWAPQVAAVLNPDRAGLVPGGQPPAEVSTEVPTAAYDAVLAALEPVPPSYLSGELAAAGAPQRVRVPRLGVDSPVVPISGQSGALTPPGDPTVLGWWQEGRPPGASEGTTVITGHTVHTGGGALDELGTLRRGDTFTVVTAAGRIRYQVAWQRDYPTAELAKQAHRLFRQDRAEPRLLLITCSGWNGQGYDDSAVVFARPVSESAPTPGP